MESFRKATEADLAKAATWVSNQHETDLWTGGRVLYPIDFRQMVEAVLWTQAGNHAIWSNELLAFGQIVPKESGRWHLARLIVNPDRRGTGLGRLLVAGLLEAARSEGASIISLNVNPLNATAIRLYERLGFRSNPRSPNAEPSRFQYMEWSGEPEMPSSNGSST